MLLQASGSRSHLGRAVPGGVVLQDGRTRSSKVGRYERDELAEKYLNFFFIMRFQRYTTLDFSSFSVVSQ